MSTQETPSQDDSNILVKNADIICPVCREVYVSPRNYDCGHTLCEICMIEMDKIDAEKANTHEAAIHSCPICRETTIKTWDQRPINISLQNIVMTHKDYEARLNELKKIIEKTVTVNVPDNTNISNLAFGKRKRIAEEIYDAILPIIYEAAVDGAGYICITEPNVVADIEKTIDVLSSMLFRKNNVYRVQVTRQECTIHLIKNANWKRDFRNNSYNNPNPNVNNDEDIVTTGVLRRLYNMPVSPMIFPPPPNL